jgi:hypothetical protein
MHTPPLRCLALLVFEKEEEVALVGVMNRPQTKMRIEKTVEAQW